MKVSCNGRYPNSWIVYNVKSHQIDDLGYAPILGNLKIVFVFILFLSLQLRRTKLWQELKQLCTKARELLGQGVHVGI